MLKNFFKRHARESGHPKNPTKSWISAFAEMTNTSNLIFFQHPAMLAREEYRLIRLKKQV